jgi:hypothetical protein
VRNSVRNNTCIPQSYGVSTVEESRWQWYRRWNLNANYLCKNSFVNSEQKMVILYNLGIKQLLSAFTLNKCKKIKLQVCHAVSIRNVLDRFFSHKLPSSLFLKKIHIVIFERKLARNIHIPQHWFSTYSDTLINKKVVFRSIKLLISYFEIQIYTNIF